MKRPIVTALFVAAIVSGCVRVTELRRDYVTGEATYCGNKHAGRRDILAAARKRCGATHALSCERRESGSKIERDGFGGVDVSTTYRRCCTVQCSSVE